MDSRCYGCWPPAETNTASKRSVAHTPVICTRDGAELVVHAHELKLCNVAKHFIAISIGRLHSLERFNSLLDAARDYPITTRVIRTRQLSCRRVFSSSNSKVKGFCSWQFVQIYAAMC